MKDINKTIKKTKDNKVVKETTKTTIEAGKSTPQGEAVNDIIKDSKK